MNKIEIGYYRFRRTFIPPFKSILSSAADVIGDWAFYLRTADYALTNPSVSNYTFPLLIVCLFSTVFGALAILSLVMSAFAYKGKPCVCAKYVTFFLGLELVLEDVPQFVMSVLIRDAMGGVWTPVSIFNVTTSAFNFTFNLLDMFLPPDKFLEEGGDGEGEALQEESQVDKYYRNQS